MTSKPAMNEKTIAELINGLPARLVSGGDQVRIAAVAEDSRLATPNSLFVARSGHHNDGRQFIHDAIKRGAVAVLTDDPHAIPDNVTGLVCEDVSLTSAHIIDRFFNQPSRSLKLIGITGTNGKTTTSYLVHQLLNDSGTRCGMIGTVQNDDGVAMTTANLTTPAAIDLSRMLRSMVDHGCRACVMETSSHALHQNRAAALDFYIGVFTNLTGDHLDYHKTMQNYFDAKAMLFESLPSEGYAILNADDPAAAKMAGRSRGHVIMCSQRDPKADCFAQVGEQTLNAIETTLVGPWGSIEVLLPLIGRHNVCNAMQAAAVCHLLGMNAESLRRGLAQCKAPPGRLEPVTTPDDGYAVLVDYAHTDDALENVLRSLRPIVDSSTNGAGKLRVVFGCGGDRDRTKRPRMAAVACKYADDVIITSDNPRTEVPEAIIDEIRTGLTADRRSHTLCLVDRAEAIHAAVDRIEDGDILLIAGKGHEDYQIVHGVKRPFDDRKVAAAALATRKARVGAT